MIGANSSDYYRRRAAQASALADAATMPAISAIHRTMAEHYASLAGSADMSPFTRQSLTSAL